MKNLMGSLLFATAIFINFPESYSYNPQRHLPSTISAIVPFHVLDRYIEVHIEISTFTNHVTIGGLTVAGPALEGVPTNDNKGTYNYITQAVYNFYGEHTVKIVVYIKEDDEKKRTLMGVKFPPTRSDLFPVDDPKHFDPHHLKWFITYKGVDFTVELHPVEKRVINIKPTWMENKRPSQEFIQAYGLKLPYIHFGGLYFIMFNTRHGDVRGAALDPYWQFRPGQPFAYLNPNNHPHTNPQAPITLEPHLIRDPNPHNAQLHANQPPTFYPTQNLHHQQEAGPSQRYPQQTPDQHHHLEQHHNAYQQQNLYQDPYHHPQLTFDPNEITYHQQNVGPSHHYPQEDANPLPNFDPFENWGYPPYHPPTP